MTTIQDNILGDAEEETKANGTETAPVLRVRAPRNPHVQTAATAEDIKLHQEVRARFRARLEAIKEEEAQILTELGEPSTKVRRVRGEVLTTRGTPKPVSESSGKELKEREAVLEVLTDGDDWMKVAAIAEAANLDRKVAARHLANLREQKKVTARGQARGTEYAAK